MLRVDFWSEKDGHPEPVEGSASRNHPHYSESVDLPGADPSTSSG